MSDSRFVVDSRFAGESEAESSKGHTSQDQNSHSDHESVVDHSDTHTDDHEDEEHEEHEGHDGHDGLGDGMLAEGFSGPAEKIVKPLTPEDLAKYKAAQEKTGVVYISRIPPGMRPTKVRHLMSQYGEIGRVYLQQEGVCALYILYK